MIITVLIRKISEAGSVLYRFWIWPFVRTYIEIKTKSIMKQRSYLAATRLAGRNYLGRNTVLRNCDLGFGSYVSNNGCITDTHIGKYTSIGMNVSTVIGKHPVDTQVAMHPAFTNPQKIFGYTYTDKKTFEDIPENTVIGNDVWIGNNVLIMGGVKIGDGAVIGTGALVTKDVPPYSINVGIPAKTIRLRFSAEQISRLEEVRWWDKDEKWIIGNIDSFSNIEEFLK